METIKTGYDSKQEIITEIYLKKMKRENKKKENMEETDTIICLKKRNENYKNIKKITMRPKNFLKN